MKAESEVESKTIEITPSEIVDLQLGSRIAGVVSAETILFLLDEKIRANYVFSQAVYFCKHCPRKIPFSTPSDLTQKPTRKLLQHVALHEKEAR